MTDKTDRLQDQVLTESACRDSAIVQHCHALWRRGECSFEEAMMYAVIHLSRQNAELVRQVIEAERWAMRPLRLTAGELAALRAAASSADAR